MNAKYIVRLSESERASLLELVKKGKAAAYKVKHANILLKADADGPAWSVARIAEAFSVHRNTVRNVCQRLVESGLESALDRKKRKTPPRSPKFTEDSENQLLELARSKAPEGRKRWTLRLLAGRAVELQIVDSVSYETVRRTLKKKDVKPHIIEKWCIPPKEDSAYVAAMEEIIDVYHWVYDPKEPRVCMDEQSVQLVKEVRVAREDTASGRCIYDSEYERNGTANVFIFIEPWKGWRHVNVTERRTAMDWAYQIRELVDVHFPEAEKIHLIMDNLNTHNPGSLYEAFPPQEAFRIARKLVIHYTPKHGSWLNMAEIELAVLTNQCLDRRIPTRKSLCREINAWESERNLNEATINWKFNIQQARYKLRSTYPRIEDRVIAQNKN